MNSSRQYSTNADTALAGLSSWVRTCLASVPRAPNPPGCVTVDSRRAWPCLLLAYAPGSACVSSWARPWCYVMWTSIFPSEDTSMHFSLQKKAQCWEQSVLPEPGPGNCWVLSDYLTNKAHAVCIRMVHRVGVTAQPLGFQFPYFSKLFYLVDRFNQLLKQNLKTAECGGWNETVSWGAEVWSQLVALGGVSRLEEVHHWKAGFAVFELFSGFTYSLLPAHSSRHEPSALTFSCSHHVCYLLPCCLCL